MKCGAACLCSAGADALTESLLCRLRRRDEDWHQHTAYGHERIFLDLADASVSSVLLITQALKVTVC